MLGLHVKVVVSMPNMIVSHVWVNHRPVVTWATTYLGGGGGGSKEHHWLSTVSHQQSGFSNFEMCCCCCVGCVCPVLDMILVLSI